MLILSYIHTYIHTVHTATVLSNNFRCIAPTTNNRFLLQEGIERRGMCAKTRDRVQNVLLRYEMRLRNSNLDNFLLLTFRMAAAAAVVVTVTVAVIVVVCE